jgi:hypothetical protein
MRSVNTCSSCDAFPGGLIFLISQARRLGPVTRIAAKTYPIGCHFRSEMHANLNACREGLIGGDAVKIGTSYKE